jgi:hypothetical protein
MHHIVCLDEAVRTRTLAYNILYLFVPLHFKKHLTDVPLLMLMIMQHYDSTVLWQHNRGDSARRCHQQSLGLFTAEPLADSREEGGRLA